MLLVDRRAARCIALPLAGRSSTASARRRTVAAMAVLLGVGLAIVAVGYLIGVAPVVVGLFVFGFANGAWDVAMNVQGARRRAPPRPLDHVPLPRRLQRRHRRGRADRRRDGRAARPGDRPPARGRGRWSAVVVPLAVRGFLPDRAAAADGRRARGPRAERRGSALAALARAAHAADRAVRPGLRLRRGRRQRLDQRRGDRRLPTPRPRVGTLAFARLPDRDDRRPLVRARPARPLRPGAGGARASPLVGIAGLLLFVFGPTTPLAFVGAAALGRRRLARLPGRHERRRRRPGGARPAGSASSPRSATARSSPARR